VMLNPPEKPGATVTIGLKDTRLFREAAAASGLELGLADYLMKILETALHNGLGEGEWSVGQYRTAETLASQKSETH
jgi:3-hydroxyisobutyrate dehydrogenase-like beta-hydroxyacid dehydrogenase